MQQATVLSEEMTAGCEDVSQSKSEQDAKVDELIREVKDGRLKLIVSAVRTYYQCAQQKAAGLKRMAENKLNAEITTSL